MIYSIPGPDLWQCPVCGRVEECGFGYAPRCAGPPERPHDGAETRLLMQHEDLPVTDDRELFH